MVSTAFEHSLNAKEQHHETHQPCCFSRHAHRFSLHFNSSSKRPVRARRQGCSDANRCCGGRRSATRRQPVPATKPLRQLILGAMKALFLAAGLALASLAMAGEDSTHRWGVGGTGPAWYETNCGLANFPGPVAYFDPQRPCNSANYRRSPSVDSSNRAAPTPAAGRSAPQPERDSRPARP